MKRRSLLLVALLVVSLAFPVFYLTTSVRAKVFSINLPNANLGVLELQIIGEYNIHLDDLNLSGFFKVGNETVNYYLEIESADICYSARTHEGSDMNVSIKYTIDYQGLNFSMFAESFSISVDYVQISSSGELVIILLDENLFFLVVYEMVPRYALTGSEWPGLEIIKKIGGSQT